MVTREEFRKQLDKDAEMYWEQIRNAPLVVNGITYDSADEYTQIKRAEAAKKKEEEEKQNKTLSARLDKQSEKYRSKYASPLKGEDLERFMVKDDQNPLGFEEMQELGGFKTNRYNKWTDPYRDRTNAGYVVGKTRLGLSQGLSGAEDAARVALANFVEGSTDTTGEMLQKDINNFGWDENKTFGGNLMANTGNAIKTAVDFANMWSRPLTRGIADNAAKVFGKGKSTEEFTRDLADKITSGNIISNLTRLDEREDALSKEAENHGKITQFAGEVGQAVGGMAPALATAAVTKNPNLALGIMSASAGGSQAREALESGATIDQAYSALITTATKEALIEKIAGGIPGLGKGAIDDLLKNAIGNRNIVKYLANSLGEGAEEILSNYLQDYINEGTFDSEEERATFAELLYSGGVGAAVSAILRVPVAFSNGNIVLRDTGNEGQSSLSTENTLANETENGYNKLFTDYDDMINYRDSLLANGQQTGSNGTGNRLQAGEVNNLSGADVMSESVSAPEHLFTAAQVLQETGASPQAVAEVLAANGTDQQTINAVISSVFGNQTMAQNQGVVNTSSSLGNNSLNSNLNNRPFDAGNAVERGLSSTLNANPQGTVGQETLNLVNESPNRYYNPVSLEQTQQQAAEALALYENETDAVSDLVGKANENGALTSQEVGAAIALIRKFSESGDYSTAASLVDTLMTTATDMGRAINALKLISKRSPEGLLAWANRQIAAINRNSSKPVELTEKDIADITALGEMIQSGNLDINIDGTSSSFQKWIGDLRKSIDDGTLEKANVKVEDALTAKAASIVSEKKPSKFLDKFRALQRIGMLTAPKTHLKNIIGNASEIGSMEAISPITSLFDRAIGKFTGNRTVEGYNANKRKDFLSGAKEGLNRTALESKLGIDLTGNSKYAIDQQGSKTKIFNEEVKTGNAKADKVLGAFNKGLNEINKGISTGLSFGDSWALYGQYRASLGEIMRLNNMTEETVTAEAIDAAWQDALRRTFRDDNKLSKEMAKISQSTGLLGAVTMPFVKTPTNVIKIAMEYSPIGTVEGIYKALYGSKSLRALKKAGGPTMALQREIAQLLAKGFVGTAIMIMGIVAGKLGFVTGDQGSEESKDRNWNQTKGELSSSIRIGNVYVDPSTMQSLASPFLAGGSSVANSEEESNTILPTLTDIAVASLNMGNSALEMPVLQGVQDLFGGKYSEANIGLALAGLAAEGAGQLVPGGTLLSQFAKTFDPYARDTSAPDKTGVEKVLAEGVNNIKAKIPGLRETLPIKYDTLGNPIYNDAGGENLAARAFNQFVNPFITSASKENEVTEEIDRLYAETKDTSILPSSVSKSFSYNGERQKLNAEELSQWQKTQGETTSDIIMNALENPQYNTMTDEQKKKLVSDAEEYAREKAKEEYLASQGIKYVRSSSAKWADKIDDLEKQGIDNSKAIFYRAALSGMETTEERAEYLMNDTSLSEAEKTAIYDAFGGVSGGYTDIIDEINFNDENDFMVSLTGSNSATNKYNSWFSSGWSVNGHSYDAIDGGMYYDLYKAYNSGSNVDERVNAIAQTLVNDYGFSEAYAEQFATDFRKKYAKTLK